MIKIIAAQGIGLNTAAQRITSYTMALAMEQRFGSFEVTGDSSRVTSQHI